VPYLSDAAVQRVLSVKIALGAERAHLDDSHPIGLVEDDGAGISVVGRHIGEPFDIAAEPVIGVLHHQSVDILVRHVAPDQCPPSFQLGRRDRGVDSLADAHALTPRNL
jgi:hypothetical protein